MAFACRSLQRSPAFATVTAINIRTVFKKASSDFRCIAAQCGCIQSIAFPGYGGVERTTRCRMTNNRRI